MINVQEIRRNVINVVKNYSDAQVKVRKATSNEPWGPSSTLMSEIADLTYNVVAFSEIMQIVWKRLNDHGKNWRHVYKALVLLEYLIKTGSEKVAQQCRDNLFAIQTLKDFQYFEDNKDQGLSIREKSKLLVALLKDEEKLKTERIRALKAKERFAQSQSAIGGGGGSLELGGGGGGGGPEGGGGLPRTSASYHESLSSPGSGGGAAGADAAARANLNPELESARPQTAGEEELQLQLALAMSKEEAEQEERLRKNDDLRLKLALEESEKGKALAAAAELQASQQQAPRSAVDDLLSLVPTTTGEPSAAAAACDPWGSPLNAGAHNHHNGLALVSSSSSAFLPSPPNNSRTAAAAAGLHQPQQRQLVDPWGAPVPTTTTSASFEASSSSSAFDDPWAGGGGGNRPNSSSALNDPWGGRAGAQSSTSPATAAANDPWNLNNGDGKTTDFLGGTVFACSCFFLSFFLSTTFLPFLDLMEPSSRALPPGMGGGDAASRRTPESFLGPNSNLVNLDALVSKTQTCK